MSFQFSFFIGGVAQCLRLGVSNPVGSTRVSFNPISDTTSQKPAAPTQLSILPISVNEYSEVTLRA